MNAMRQPVPEENVLVITRVINAPRERVWQAWTDPELAKRWEGPKGYTVPVFQIDFREGGKYFMSMRSPEGRDFYSTGVYKKIDPPNMLVCTDSFADEQGNVVPASHYEMGVDFPLELLITVTLEDLDGKTRMTVRHQGMPAGETSEQAEAGWNESFDKLESVLQAD